MEFDGIVQGIDLILHKFPLYRHLLLNRPFKVTRWHKAAFLLANGMIDVFCRLHFEGLASASNRVIVSLLIRSICGNCQPEVERIHLPFSISFRFFDLLFNYLDTFGSTRQCEY